mmetsp:Transcript_4162/g.9473  ORF Transcript_4162/g.9473 Transcript_4162/m.9473 type:complete len:370 (+) Transcript_4162:96-1205(+)|eukprot:CAMPEP_0171359222 /NCGR_PEP_ID=MMETSP0879-20121228/476_1 /TAXON_ID=67004 /ORGANISM="Thalassiosira weissflogii, Strain CCMP1336" /LENGTH=369 /DNA_ID=CAMNT_0011865361 /DNA_START=30 /DNA_END=1139 /DNA_ORIENTATION=-
MNISKWRAVPFALLGLLSVAWISFMDAGAGDQASLRSIVSGSIVFSTDTWDDPRNLMADPSLNTDATSLTLDSPTSEKAHTVLSETFDDKNSVVFLIAFGEAATSSTYVERNIMSLRRRGEFQGHVLVLTDAPDERYDGLFDEKVIIMHPKEEHMKTDFLYPSMTVKRFKTYIIDYVDMVPELDDVEWIFYLDIDVLFGAPFMDLIQKLGEENDIRGDDDMVSKFYFFKNPRAYQYVAQGGFIIAHRKMAKECLDLWRREIDSHLEEEHDQVSLNLISRSIEEGKERSCRLMIMDQGDHISYPRHDGDLYTMMRDRSYSSLIHIKNTANDTSFGNGVHERFVTGLLKLTFEEKKQGEDLVRKSFFGYEK